MIREQTTLVPVDGSKNVYWWLILLIILPWKLHRVWSIMRSLLSDARLERTTTIELEFVSAWQILNLIVLLFL
jgi:hypothetical protein